MPGPATQLGVVLVCFLCFLGLGGGSGGWDGG